MLKRFKTLTSFWQSSISQRKVRRKACLESKLSVKEGDLLWPSRFWSKVETLARWQDLVKSLIWRPSRVSPTPTLSLSKLSSNHLLRLTLARRSNVPAQLQSSKKVLRTKAERASCLHLSYREASREKETIPLRPMAAELSDKLRTRCSSSSSIRPRAMSRMLIWGRARRGANHWFSSHPRLSLYLPGRKSALSKAVWMNLSNNTSLDNLKTPLICSPSTMDQIWTC